MIPGIPKMPRRVGAAVLVLVAAIMTLTVPMTGCEAGGGQTLKVFDGDSFLMRGDDGGDIEVRLYGIDAPERHQPWSRRSREALFGLIRGRALTLELVETDRYGRAVAKVTREPDGLIVNAEMVRAGNAWVYRRYTRDPALLQRLGLEDLMELEESARQQRRGLWSLPPSEQTPPWEWRRQKRRHDN